MLKELFRNRLFIGALAFFVLCVCGSLLYMQHVAQQGAEELAETQERVAQWNEKQKPTTEGKAGDTSQGGHFHADGTWHAAEPHAAVVASDISTPRRTPVAFADGVNPTSTSSNPLFKDGVPKHLQCPPEFIGVYLNEDKANILPKILPIYEEIKEKWNPDRPLAEVWDPMIEADKWYRENADPEKAELFGAAGRLDWLVQQWLDFPEITILLDEDAPRASDMLRVDIGLFKPDWNAFTVTVADGSSRIFRRSYDKKYVLTWGGRVEPSEDGTSVTTWGPATHTTGPINGDPNAEVIHINLDEVADEELERLGGWNFNINPYTTGQYKLGDNR